ncbi:Uncharacterized protein GBIM_12105 [Gryllus bimaculatus]|nr:Uncharacterized protein GBIM_12105 [Gryllus bimaculatus]
MGDSAEPEQTYVPTLPLFIDESNCGAVNTLTSNTELESKEILIPSSSSTKNNEHRRHRRKGRRCTNHTCERCHKMKEEVLVHTSRQKHHYHHRRKSYSHTKLHDNAQTLLPENQSTSTNPLPGGGEQSTSEILDTFSQDDIPQGNAPVQKTEIPQEVLFLEIEKLRAINYDLNRRLQTNLSSTDSGCQPSAEDVIKSKEDEIKNLQLNILQLDKLQQDLQRQRDALKSQLEETSKEHVSNEGHNTRMNELQLENEKLSEDVKLLKELVCKYNAELANYQERLRKYKGDDSATPPHVLAFPPDFQGKGSNLAWEKINKEALGPLLLAYSETIQEKNDLIQEFEENHKKSLNNCRTLAEENGKLFQELEDLKLKNEAKETQWNVLKEDSKITHEHNELLTISGISKDLEEVCSKYHTCRGDLLTLQGRYTVLREEYEKLKNDAESKIPYSVHASSVAECRKLFEELKLKYETDKKEMTIKIAELEAEKPHLEGKLATAESENEQLRHRVQSMEKSIKKTQVRCDSFQGKLVAAQVSRDSAKRQLQKAMAFAEELVEEQEQLLKQLHKKQEETRSIARLGSTIVYRMGSLRTKLKSVQEGAWQELDVIEKRIKQQEAGVDHMKKEYHQEVVRLRNLVKQKETIIGRLQKEKSKTEENLEVVWRAATSEDIHIKETLKQVNFHPNTSHVKFYKGSDSSNGTI